jgi:hypothetical protein
VLTDTRLTPAPIMLAVSSAQSLRLAPQAGMRAASRAGSLARPGLASVRLQRPAPVQPAVVAPPRSTRQTVKAQAAATPSAESKLEWWFVQCLADLWSICLCLKACTSGSILVILCFPAFDRPPCRHQVGR